MSVSLRELQLCELQVLKEIRSICEKNQIRYYLSSGTLLGAVRHQGFIPWDDDVDIEMPYPDYLRFIAIAQEELGDSGFLQNHDTDPYFHFAYSRVRKNGTTMMREWEATFSSHHGVWVDVFPMVTVGGNADYRFKRFLLKLCTFLRMHDEVFSLNESWLKEQSSAMHVFLIKLTRRLSQKRRDKLADRIFRYVMRQRRQPYLSNVWTNITRRIPKEAFEPAAELQFEGEGFSVPKDYDAYLRIAYGDYMTPPPAAQRGTRHGKLYVDLDRAWQPGEELPDEGGVYAG